MSYFNSAGDTEYANKRLYDGFNFHIMRSFYVGCAKKADIFNDI